MDAHVYAKHHKCITILFFFCPLINVFAAQALLMVTHPLLTLSPVNWSHAI